MKQLNDQYFTYRQTPVDYDGVARPSIKGNTLVWNQLVGNIKATQTVSGVTYTNNNDGSISINGTASGTSFFDITNVDISIVNGHKYLFKGAIGGSANCRMDLRRSAGTILDGTETSGTDIIFTATETVLVKAVIRVGNGTTISNIKFIPQLFDLTAMFGSGNEPTIDQFKSLFPLNYYAYNSGSLLNFNGSGIKTTGKNLLDVSSGSGTGASGFVPTYADGVLEFKAMTTGTVQIWTMVFPLYETKAYTLSFDACASEDGTRIIFDGQPDALYNAYSGNALGKDKQTDVSTTKTRYTYSGVLLDGTTQLRFYRTNTLSKATTSAVYISNVQLEFGSSASTYEPYHTETSLLPISTYFPTGMKSAGTVYDELSDKAITRVGSYTFTGNEVISSSADLGTYYRVEITGSSITPNIKGLGGTVYPQATSSFAPYEVNYSGDSLHFYYYGNTWRLFIPVSSNAEALTYLTGKEINYELATYTEQDVDPIYYDFYGNGTEQLLPVNTDTPTTSPLLADIIYYNLTDSEVPYRVFWAINSKGERWDFTEREFKSFMNNPQGLGFSKTISVNRYGNTQSLTDISDNFPQPNGEVLFYDSSNSTRYDKYNQFVKFLSYEPITLYYKIPVSFYSRIPNTYSLECVVGTLTKTESKTDNMMNCSITYNALSFYKGEEVEIRGTGLTYTINNDGDFPVGFEIEINATYNFYMKNPYIQLSQDGSLYGEAKFIDDTRFNKVYINSKDGEQNVILQQSGSVLPNPMSYQDLSISNGSIYVTFVKLARGETTLTIGADSQNITDVTIKYTPIYRSV